MADACALRGSEGCLDPGTGDLCRPELMGSGEAYAGRMEEWNRRNRSELLTTETDDRAMAAEASIGSKSMPVNG